MGISYRCNNEGTLFFSFFRNEFGYNIIVDDYDPLAVILASWRRAEKRKQEDENGLISGVQIVDDLALSRSS
jgi:hypothetical protein